VVFHQLLPPEIKHTKHKTIKTTKNQTIEIPSPYRPPIDNEGTTFGREGIANLDSSEDPSCLPH
jgi:hypothetical protein